jgi:hypothetical protein
MSQKRLKKPAQSINYYKDLIDKALLLLIQPGKKSKRAKASSLGDLDLVLGVYRFVSYDFEKYSTCWNYSRLAKFLDTDEKLVKWFTLKIFSLLLTPRQASRLVAMYFDETQCAQLRLVEHALLLNTDINVDGLSRPVSFRFDDFDDELLSSSKRKTNFSRVALEQWKFKDAQKN